MLSLEAIRRRHQKKIPPLDFNLLLAASLRRPKEFLFARPEYQPTVWQRLRLAYFLFSYRRGFSIAAITRRKEFYGLNFFVNRRVLIPRPETELIAAAVINEINSQPTGYRLPTICLIDIGTGSGCIPIVIAKKLEQRQGRSIKFYATDISRSALRVASRNARTHKVFINFLHGNLLEPFVKTYQLLPISYQLIITANLPYLAAAQFTTEPSIQREPRQALVGGITGLELYEELLPQIQSLFLIHYSSFIIFLEIDPAQSAPATLLIKKYFPAATVEIKTDLAGRKRLIIVRLNS